MSRTAPPAPPATEADITLATATVAEPPAVAEAAGEVPAIGSAGNWAPYTPTPEQLARDARRDAIMFATQVLAGTGQTGHAVGLALEIEGYLNGNRSL
jgi:hypothetical protein